MSKPVRIAQIIGKWVGGGVESVVMNYYRNINKEKIQFDFICDEDSTNIPYEEIEKMGGRVILIPPYQKVFSYQKKLRKILNENNYKIIHSHINTLSVFPLLAAKSVGIPIRIAHSHSTTNKKEWKKNLLKQVLRPFSKLFATNYFCCSALAGIWLFGKKEYTKKKVFLLNNAINLDRFKFDNKIRQEYRKNLNIKNNTLVVGHVGRFVKQKNHEFLIDVFKSIHDQEKNSILILVGQGPLKGKIQNKVKELELDNCVIFLEQREDVDKLYQAFDIFLLPSLYEGLPVVGIEAQASGLLTILSSSMTKETKILETTTIISLKQPSSEWAQIILEKHDNHKRKDTVKEMSLNGFNIKEEAIKLENKYTNLLK